MGLELNIFLSVLQIIFAIVSFKAVLMLFNFLKRRYFGNSSLIKGRLFSATKWVVAVFIPYAIMRYEGGSLAESAIVAILAIISVLVPTYLAIVVYSFTMKAISK